jgi:hypothetical protein
MTVKKRGPKIRQKCNGAQRAYIVAHVQNGGIKRRACLASGTSYDTLFKWLRKDYFQEALSLAEREWQENIEAALYARAIKKSDTAAIFLLKAADPERYDEGVRKQRIANRGLESAVAKLAPPIYETVGEEPDEGLPPPCPAVSDGDG